MKSQLCLSSLKKHCKIQTVFIVLVVILTLSIGGSLDKTMAADPGIVGSSLVADIAETNSPKVVWIETTYENKQTVFSPFGDFNQETIPTKGFGSGFFFNDKGYILTNYHVVDGAKSIAVKLKDQKESIPATYIGGDQILDVAIIKIDSNKKTPFIKFGDSDKARVGEWVIAIGNPHNLDHTVTLGIISAKGRPVTVGKTNNLYEDMIQTDAAINPGNSGGPLLNTRGEVIGINTLVASGQGLGFAIPINTIKKNLDTLMEKGKLSHPWLGVGLRDYHLDEETRNYLNLEKNDIVMIVSPVKNGPAAKAGLRHYDVVLEVNNQEIISSDQLIKMIRKMKVGDKLTIMISRKGTLMTKEVVLEERPTS